MRGSALTKGITNTRYSYKLGVSPRWASQERLLTSSERRVHAHKAPTSKRKKSSWGDSSFRLRRFVSCSNRAKFSFFFPLSFSHSSSNIFQVGLWRACLSFVQLLLILISWRWQSFGHIPAGRPSFTRIVIPSNQAGSRQTPSLKACLMKFATH